MAIAFRPLVQAPFITGFVSQIVLQRQLNRSIQQAYANLCERFPECNDILFDEWFLLHSALPLLQRHVAGEGQLTATALAIAWDKQLDFSAEKRQQRIQPVIPIATEFLGRFNAHI